ncbi:nucleoside monophosphate kinase [Candidatus Parcubacteria bacterium]|nr:MAG: nucleoside monophosphate kinase [Candidatus Parcubacteria bacterium]
MEFDAVFIIGPQGSGKNTQASVLAARLGFFFWETGATLRKNADTMLSSGERVGDILKSGRLFADEELMEVIEEELRKLPRDKGIVLEGIPRRVSQAELILKFLESIGKHQFATIFLDLPKEESIQRLLLRAEKEGRSDDTREAIGRRLAAYHADTVPMLEFLKGRTAFFNIDGRPSVEEVTRSVNKALGLT